MWPDDVLEHVRPAATAAFPDRLRERAASRDDAAPRWSAAHLPIELGLEQWIGWLGLFDKRAYVSAAAAAARHAYPLVIARAGAGAMELGLHADAPCEDGASEGAKVALVEAWLAAPSRETIAALERAVDPSRQLQIWDEDLWPADDAMWQWFLAVGELTARAVVHREGGAQARGDDPYGWPAEMCAARAVVCALKSIRLQAGDVDADAAALGRAIAAAFGVA